MIKWENKMSFDKTLWEKQRFEADQQTCLPKLFEYMQL